MNASRQSNRSPRWEEDADWASRAQSLERFSVAWTNRDLDGLMELRPENCSFRASVGPEPGASFEGRQEVRRGFELFLGGGPTSRLPPHTDLEPPLIAPDFAVTRWTSKYPQPDGPPVIVRACDIFGFEDGRIKFKDTYRKVPGYMPQSL